MESFEPFRVVGCICGGVPVSCTTLYGTPVLMVATGRTFQLFKGKELSMLRGGPTLQEPLRSVAHWGKYRFAAEGPRVHAWVHHKPLWEVMHHELTQPAVTHLLARDDLLFCHGEDKRIVVREIKTGRLMQELFVKNNENVTSMSLPTGYTNKLLVATAQGSLHLYNFKTAACVWYTTPEATMVSRASILCLACSAFKDIIAYGTSDGKVVVLNMSTAAVITTFDHQQGAVTALAFRMDKDNLLMSGTSLGEVVVWDVENRCMDGALTRSKQVRSEAEVLETPHLDAVHSLITFEQPEHAALTVTAGADNALMQFRFDTVDALGLLVRERRGHMGSCTVAAFYNEDLLITAGQDRAVRVTHVFSDRASWELSQGKLGKKGRERRMGREALKMSSATAIASCTTRNYQWASVVMLHQASAQLSAWRMDTRALEFKLTGIKTCSHTARAVCISGCGNFAVVGYSSGNAVVMNLQNRSLRQLFDPSLEGDRSHEAAVECVEVSCSNTIVITASLDGVFKLWSLSSGALQQSVPTSQPITKSCVHQESSLLAVAQHFMIRVYHCNPEMVLTRAELQTPVREFMGHAAPITALALAPDSFRYIVSASGDGALLVWDLAAAACVGQYRFPSPATSLSFHPDALFFATTHAGERGTFLWINNLRYGYVPEVIFNPLERDTDTLPWLHFPTAHGTSEEKQANDNSNQENEARDAHEAQTDAPLFDSTNDIALVQCQKLHEQREALDKIEVEGLRLSSLPRTVWFDLTVLDQIREKNRPLLPPKKKHAPFFLPTTQELRPTFILTAQDQTSGGDVPGPRVVSVDVSTLTDVQRMLIEEEHELLMNHFLKKRSAQAIDLDIKHAVNYDEGVNYTSAELDIMKQCLRSLLRFFTIWIRRKENIDLLQGLLADVLRSHTTALVRFAKELASDMLELAEVQKDLHYNMDHMVSYPSCLTGVFSGSVF